MPTRIRTPKNKLNNDQRAVVDYKHGSCIVSAGPGSGKTFCIVERINRLINNKVVNPSKILATTFTRKAAEEMNARLKAKHIDTSRMSVQTMHSFCWKIVRAYPAYRGWTIDDNDTNHIVLKTIIGYRGMNWRGVDITKVHSFISMCRNSLISPENSSSMLQGDFADHRYAMAYLEYHDKMQERHLITFDDMLYYGVNILEHDDRSRDDIQASYEFVIVDEFQDSNIAQIRLAEIVAHPEYNYMVVGDTDQAIYSWRGAVPEFMLEFQTKYNADLISLGTNYRCVPAIVEASALCIRHNELRIDKNLVSHRSEANKITYMICTNTDEEATYIRQIIQQMFVDGVNPESIFILMRTNAQSRAIEEEFIKHDVPFIVLGSSSFYERKEIKDILAYIRLIYDPRDSENGERAITRPFRYLSRNILDQIGSIRGEYINSVLVVAERIGGVSATKLREFANLVGSFSDTDNPSETIRRIVSETGYLTYLKEEEGTEGLETNRANNIGELISSATRFKTIPEFVTYVDRQIKLRKRNLKKKENRIQIMTIHKAKGMENDTVFLIDANEGILPHSKGEETEERRLFYVAMTRARTNLFVTSVEYANGEKGSINMLPSRFIAESGLTIEHTSDSVTHTLEVGVTGENTETV